MGPAALAAIGIGAGLGKSLLEQQQERKQRELAALQMQWSPWTGMQPQMPKGTDWGGNMAQGGLAGASLGQGMEQQAANDELRQAQVGYLNRSGWMGQPRLGPGY